MTNQTLVAPAAPTALAAAESAAETLRRLAISPNTRIAYTSALKGFATWLTASGLDAAQVTDHVVAAYVGHLQQAGRSPASAATFVAAVKRVAKESGQQPPVGIETEETLQGFRNHHAATGAPSRQARGFSLEDVTAIITTSLAATPRKVGRGFEKPATAKVRGFQDAAMVGLCFYAGMRRSEISRITFADIEDVNGSMVKVRVRTSKTNRDGSKADWRIVKNGAAFAIKALRDAAADPTARIVPLNPATINTRIKRAAAETPGVDAAGVTAHSGRVGLACELVRRGASTTAVQHAGGWKSSRMVAHYSASVEAESGAVAELL